MSVWILGSRRSGDGNAKKKPPFEGSHVPAYVHVCPKVIESHRFLPAAPMYENGTLSGCLRYPPPPPFASAADCDQFLVMYKCTLVVTVSHSVGSE